MRDLFQRLWQGSAGQNTAEYAIIVAMIVATVFLVIDVFMGSLATYHQDITSVVCLPVP